MAVSIASLSNVTYMIIKLHKSFGAVGWSDMRAFSLRLAVTSMAAAVAFALGSRLFSTDGFPPQMMKLLDVAIPSIAGCGVFALGIFAFRLFDDRLIGSSPEGASS
jgi:hypothetical protein